MSPLGPIGTAIPFGSSGTNKLFDSSRIPHLAWSALSCLSALGLPRGCQGTRPLRVSVQSLLSSLQSFSVSRHSVSDTAMAVTCGGPSLKMMLNHCPKVWAQKQSLGGQVEMLARCLPWCQ